MGKQKYPLNAGEKIIYKVTRVRNGFWGAYSNTLVITNHSVILEKYGLFDNFKGAVRFNHTDINQAILGVANNGEEQLELYIGDIIEDFALQSGDTVELKVLVKAINDQINSPTENNDIDYYQQIYSSEHKNNKAISDELEEYKDDMRLIELQSKYDDNSLSNGSNVSLAGDIVKNLMSSGNFTSKGISKAVKKSIRKQTSSGLLDGLMDSLLDEIGIRDIQDEFIEIGNEFREEFGLKTQMTYAEKKELRELEDKKKQRDMIKKQEAARQDRLNKKVNEAPSKNSNSYAVPPKLSMKDQLKLLQQLKALMDDGALTPEEFEKKKQEILNN